MHAGTRQWQRSTIAIRNQNVRFLPAALSCILVAVYRARLFQHQGFPIIQVDPVHALDDLDGMKTFIDAVAISHEFTDHCHEQTLLQVDPDVPVFATEVRKRSSTSPGQQLFLTWLPESGVFDQVMGSFPLGPDHPGFLS